MSTTIYQAFLVLHITGITVMAGTSFVDLIIFRSFKKAFRTDAARSRVIEEQLYKLQRFMGIGMLLILISGIGMMVKLHEVWGAQIWFRVKMGILLLVIINGLGLRRMFGSRLRKALTISPAADSNNAIESIARNFVTVQLIQLLFFIIIYVLSVFKFN